MNLNEFGRPMWAAAEPEGRLGLGLELGGQENKWSARRATDHRSGHSCPVAAALQPLTGAKFVQRKSGDVSWGSSIPGDRSLELAEQGSCPELSNCGAPAWVDPLGSDASHEVSEQVSELSRVESEQQQVPLSQAQGLAGRCCRPSCPDS